MKYAVSFQQLASSLFYSGFAPLTAWHTLMAKRPCPSAGWWFRPASPGAGQRWCADIQASWFDGDKKDAQSPRPQACCRWNGLSRADEKWATATRTRSASLNPKSRCTLLGYTDAVYYKYCHKAGRAAEYVASSRTRLLSWKQCPSVTVCQEPVPHAWGTAVTFQMTIILCSLLFVAISGKRSHLGINQVEHLCVRVCACLLLDVNKNTTLKQGVIKRCWKKWKAFFTQWSVWRCESSRAARLTSWLSFLTYTDGTQLSKAHCGLRADGFVHCVSVMAVRW